MRENFSFSPHLKTTEFYEIVLEKILPGMLNVLEESGINSHDAELVPKFLDDAIKENNKQLKCETPFKVIQNPPESTR